MLADFPNISRWNGGVSASHATSEATGGVGATRHCDLSPAGALEETIVEWEPEHRLVVRIDKAEKIPIDSGLVTFTIEAGDADSSTTTLDYRFETKWGIVGRLMTPLLENRLRAGFTGFLDDLDRAAASDGAGQEA